MPNAANTQAEKILDFVQCTGALMEKVAAERTTKEAQDKQVEQMIPRVVKVLLDNDRIYPQQEKEAAELLKDPVKVLEILANTAVHKNAEERARIGKPDTREKKASNYNSLTDSYVGRRVHPEEPESYRAFKRGIGLA